MHQDPEIELASQLLPFVWMVNLEIPSFIPEHAGTTSVCHVHTADPGIQRPMREISATKLELCPPRKMHQPSLLGIQYSPTRDMDYGHNLDRTQSRLRGHCRSTWDSLYLAVMVIF